MLLAERNPPPTPEHPVERISTTIIPTATETQEGRRLIETHGKLLWRRWGPYVSERSWGTVREDYSSNGAAWDFLSHDVARSKAYRSGEDGLAAICDRYQLLVFSLALWNGKDAILKERAFGLTPSEGNHGEDVKEYYFYLDNTPTHFLYEVPLQVSASEVSLRAAIGGKPKAQRQGTGVRAFGYRHLR